MSATNKFITATALILITLIYGCASSPTASGEGFNNILVLAIADDYDGRAQYERTVASDLRRLGISATPYHQAVSGSGDISRERALELVAEHGFDAVLVTQVRSLHSSVDVAQDSASTKVVRKDGRPINFFRYDYEELDEPGAMSLLAEATLDTDLHRAPGGDVVWTFSWSSNGAENAGILIDESSTAVVRRLNRDKVLAR